MKRFKPDAATKEKCKSVTKKALIVVTQQTCVATYIESKCKHSLLYLATQDVKGTDSSGNAGAAVAPLKKTCL